MTVVGNGGERRSRGNIATQVNSIAVGGGRGVFTQPSLSSSSLPDLSSPDSVSLDALHDLHDEPPRTASIALAQGYGATTHAQSPWPAVLRRAPVANVGLA